MEKIMSDVWDEFEKMAVAQGLVSVADHVPTKLPDRYDSLSDDAIRLLYNVEPDPENKKTIIEIAHPETFTVGRAYDAMNSVVENEHQHQDMMAYIALKMPNGNLTQRRYVAAKQELLKSLISSAFVLDSREEEGLMSLADSCATRLDQREGQFTKEGSPLIMAGVAAGVAAVGLVYYLGWGAPTAQNVYVNSRRVLEALKPLSRQPYAASISKDVSYIMKLALEINNMKRDLSSIRSIHDTVSATQDVADKAKLEAADKKKDEYVAQLNKVYEAIPGWVSSIWAAHTDTEVRSDFMAKLHNMWAAVTDTPDEKLIYELIGKSDLFTKLKQWIPGMRDFKVPGKNEGEEEAVHCGLYEAIRNDVDKLSRSFTTAKNQAPQIQEALDMAKKQELPEAPPVAAQPAKTQGITPPKDGGFLVKDDAFNNLFGSAN
jgi:hypothetical protein